MENNPLVSVIIPFHNEPNIDRAINSVLSQNYKNIEVIAIDDTSTDDCVLKAKAIKDSRLIVLQNEKNLNAGMTRNVGLNKAKGDFICFLDGDDLFVPNKIENDLKFLFEHQEFDLLCSERIPLSDISKDVEQPPLLYKEVTLKKMLFKSQIFTSSVMMRNTVKDRFPEYFYISEDLYYWCLILLSKHRICKVNQYTAYYNNAYENRLSMNFKKQYISEKKIVDMVYQRKAINWFEKIFFKLLYFVKYLRRPAKFKKLAKQQQKDNKAD